MERFETLSKVLALADLSTCFSDNGIGNFERAFNKNLVAKIIPERKEYKHLATILKPGHENVALISKDPYWYIIQKSGKEDKLIIANCGITTNEIVEDVLNDPEIIYAENSFSEQSAQQITVFQEYDSVKDINVYIKEIINRLFYTKLLSTNSFTTHMAVFLEIAFYNLCCLQAIKTDLPISLYMNQRLSLSISLQDYAFDLRKGLANVSCYDEAFLEMSNILKMDDIDESIST
ncbi:hypothetical protein CLU79DRAFT_889382, partial [Phycomyces nitens]